MKNTSYKLYFINGKLYFVNGKLYITNGKLYISNGKHLAISDILFIFAPRN